MIKNIFLGMAFAGLLLFTAQMMRAQDSAQSSKITIDDNALKGDSSQTLEEMRAKSGADEAHSIIDVFPTFSLTLSAKTYEFRVGSQMRITITQTNLTKHGIDCTSEWDGIDRTYQYEVTDEDGKPAEKLHRGNAGWDVHPSILAAGESNSANIIISRIFTFDRPGKYVIRVSRKENYLTDEKGEPLVVWSNPITITITG